MVCGSRGHNSLRQPKLCLTVDDTGALASSLLIGLCVLWGTFWVESSQSGLIFPQVGSHTSPAPSVEAVYGETHS